MEIPYLFHRAGCIVHVFGRKDSWLLKSRYPKKYIPAPETQQEYLTELLSQLQKNTYDWVVPGDDTVLRLVVQLPPESEGFQKMSPIHDPYCVSLIGSKAQLSQLCALKNITTPLFAIYHNHDDLTVLAEQVTFPLVLKVDQSCGGHGVYLCNTQKDVTETFSKLPDEQKNNIVLQKYIAGENIAIESIYKEGRLVIYSHAIVTKTLNGEFGISSERKYTECPEIESLLEKIGSAFSIHGFCSMTLMHLNGKYFLIEADCRPQTWYPLAALAGIDFSRGITAFFENTAHFIRPKLPQGKHEVYIRHFSRDHIWSLQNRDFSHMFKWFYNSENRLKALPLHDPMMLFRSIIRGSRHFFARLRGR